MEKFYLVPEGKSRAEITQAHIVDSLIMVKPIDDAPTLKIPGDWKTEASHFWGVRKDKLDSENFFHVDNRISTSRSDNDWEDFTENTAELKSLFVSLFEEINPDWKVSANLLRIQKRYDSAKVYFFDSHRLYDCLIILLGLYPSRCNQSDDTSSILSYQGRNS